MKRLCRQLFVVLLARPVIGLWLGLTVRHRARLPQHGPAVIVANHNSHLDILALYSLFPLARIPDIRPAAAADYFLSNRLFAWFSRSFVGIIPVLRGTAGNGNDPLAECAAALRAGQTLIIFPEGTRGEPEALAPIKPGIWHLMQQFPQVPIVPVYLHGLGRAMPKGSWLPLPSFVDAEVGEAFYWQADKAEFVLEVGERLKLLQQHALQALKRPVAVEQKG